MTNLTNFSDPTIFDGRWRFEIPAIPYCMSSSWEDRLSRRWHRPARSDCSRRSREMFQLARRHKVTRGKSRWHTGRTKIARAAWCAWWYAHFYFSRHCEHRHRSSSFWSVAMRSDNFSLFIYAQQIKISRRVYTKCSFPTCWKKQREKLCWRNKTEKPAKAAETLLPDYSRRWTPFLSKRWRDIWASVRGYWFWACTMVERNDQRDSTTGRRLANISS